MPRLFHLSPIARQGVSVLFSCFLLFSPAVSEPAGVEGVVASTLKPEQVRKLADQAKQETGLSEATRKQIQTLYTQALEQLDLAVQWQAKVAEYEDLRLKAPDLLRSLTEELSRTGEDSIPPPGPGADLVVLEQRLAEAERVKEAAEAELAELKSEKARRGERRLALPNLLVDARSRLEDLTKKSAEPGAGVTAALAQAQQTLQTAQRQASQLEISAYEEELLSYEARGDLLQARMDVADRRVAAVTEAVGALGPIVEQRRAEDAAAAVREAEREAEQAHPALRDLTRQNLELTKNQATLTESIDAGRKRTAEKEELLGRLETERKRIEERVNAAGLTHAIGQFLRKQRADLPNPRQLQKGIRDLKREVGAVQTRILELEEQRDALGKLPAGVAAILQQVDPATPGSERRQIETEAEELLKAQRETLDRLLDDLGTYFAVLVDLDVTERRLVEEVRRFGLYIDENVLWIESASWLGPADLKRSGEAALWLVRPEAWLSIPRSIWGTVRASPFLSLALVVVVAVLLGGRNRIRSLLQPGSSRVVGAFGRTVRQLLSVLLMALIWPALLWLLDWLLVSPYDSSEFAKSLGAGLRASSVILFGALLSYRLCADDGVGAKTFRWHKKLRQALRAELRWLIPLIVPAGFISGVFDFQTNEAYRESLGRMIFVAAFIALAVAARRLLRPDGAVLGQLIRENPDGWMYRLRYLWYGLGVGVPAGLALAAAGGYYYTAYFLSWRLVETFWLLLGLILFHSLVQYWLKLQVYQHSAEELAEAEQTTGDGMQVRLKDEELDAAAISAQAGQLLRTAVLVSAVVGGWLIWANTLPALSVLDEVTLWSTQVETAETVTRPDGSTGINKLVQQVPITLADVGLALVIVVITFVSSRNIPGLLEITLLDRLPFAPSVGYAITSLSKYTIVAVGLVIAFNTIGISWAKVQWLVAAMTVGLAFGLQEIFANLVSGIIILFERPIRVGDVVTVGNVSGVVSRIRIRATTITDWDRKELIVPNKRFITTEILNWTLSDAIIRVVFPVAVSRGPKLEEVRAILLGIAQMHRLVLQDPAPSVVFAGFGPGSLRFDLRVFIRRDDYAKVLDAVNTAIEEGLAAAGVEIAAERQEIQVRPPRELPRGEKPMSFPSGHEDA